MPATQPVPDRGASAPRLAHGAELLGEYHGSGFQDPRYLARRSDGQVMQLSRLLYLVAARLDGRRDLGAVAAQVGRELDREISAEDVSFLIEARLQPAGLVETGAAAGAPPPVKPDPLLGLRFRLGVVPARAAWAIGGVFRPLFWPPVIAVALAAFAGLDIWTALHGALARIAPDGRALIYQPALTLLVLGVVIVAAAFHECGHVTACRYGGARPGVMGFGLYLVWPAFYSTVTDSYRLGRGGRLRTDLGGVYFNAIFIAGMTGAYLATGLPWLLVFAVLWHVETAWQFLPSLRLDGYYILADLVGVPDLFSRMGPVLRSLLPGRRPCARVRELKPWVRLVVTGWVTSVLAVMLCYLGAFLLLAPRLVPAEANVLALVGGAVAAALAAGAIARAALGAVQLLLIVLPLLGIALITGSVTAGLARACARRLARRPAPPPGQHRSSRRRAGSRPA